MRNVFTASAGLVLLIATPACDSGPGQAQEPPILKVTSPARSLIQDHAGPITVRGTAEPGASGDPVEEVLVNGVEATLSPDGSFEAVIEVEQGATLIQTVARDASGSTASDTRAALAGQLRAVGSKLDRAITAALSADAFARISAAAGPFLEGLDLASLLAPLQPMVHAGDDRGEDCNFARLFVDDIAFSSVEIALSPIQGGLALRVEIDGLDVPARARYAVLCADGSNTLRVTAGRVTVAGTLQVAPAGMAGFETRLIDPDVHVSDLHLDASGIPGSILDLLHLDSAIQFIVARGAELAMGPLVNHALGALAGPQQLDLLGTTLDLQVAPRTIALTPAGAAVAMDVTALLAGSESSPGFLFTPNRHRAIDPGHGFEIGLADDLINELFAELHALGTLDLSVPQDVGVFDTAQIQLTLPPVISAGASDGRMRLVLGDMLATFTSAGTPVARAAINARVDLEIAPAAGGGAVALQLGTPELHVDVLDDVPNTTGLSGRDLASATEAGVAAQIDALTRLLVAIPVPSVAGLHVQNLAIGSDDGYVVVSGQLR